jgi:hypothetical protein
MSVYDYNAAAFHIDGDVQSRGFYSITEAILWLRRRLLAEDDRTVYGEVRCRDQLLWRRGTPPVDTTQRQLARLHQMLTENVSPFPICQHQFGAPMRLTVSERVNDH